MSYQYPTVLDAYPGNLLLCLEVFHLQWGTTVFAERLQIGQKNQHSSRPSSLNNYSRMSNPFPQSLVDCLDDDGD
jgi:hypothetical protein